MRKAVPLLACLLTAACHTEVQPLVIDLTALRTPTAAPSPLPTAAPPSAAPTAAALPAPTPAAPPSPAAEVSGGAPVARTPEQIVQAQVAAYNRADLEALLSFYSQDSKLYDHPGRLTESGLAEIRQRYARRLSQTPQLRVTGRMVQGDFVLERVEAFGAGAEPARTITIYEVRHGKIANVWFIR
jgi:hypothetical protein